MKIESKIPGPGPSQIDQEKIQPQAQKAASEHHLPGAMLPVVAITDLGLQEYSRLKREFNPKSLPDALDDPSISEADELERFVIAFGNSRLLPPYELVRICRGTFGDTEVSRENWFLLRRSTFPYRLFARIEQTAIDDAANFLLEFAAQTGLVVFNCYLALRISPQDSPAYVVLDDSADVGIAENKVEWNPSTRKALELPSATLLSPSDGIRIEVATTPPEDSPYKTITLVKEGASRKLLAFPNSIVYSSPSAQSSLRAALKRVQGTVELQSLANLIGTFGAASAPALVELRGLLSSHSQILRASVVDVLRDIGTEESIQILVDCLEQEREPFVSERILFALSQLPSPNANAAIYAHLACHSVSPFIIQTVANRMDREGIVALLKNLPCCPKTTIKNGAQQFQTKLLAATLKSIDASILFPLLFDLLADSRTESKILILDLFPQLVRDCSDEAIRSSATKELILRVCDPDEKIAVRAARSLSDLRALSDEESFQIALKTLHSRARAILLKAENSDSVDSRATLIDALEKERSIPNITDWLLAKGRAMVLVLELALVFGLIFLNASFVLHLIDQAPLIVFLMLITTLPPLLAWQVPSRSTRRKSIGARLSWGFAVSILAAAIFGVALWIQVESMYRIDDRFNQSSVSRWSLTDDESVTSKVANGYLITSIKKPMITWSNLLKGYSGSDLDVSVRATMVGGANETLYGITFRKKDPDNYYQFALTSDGQVLLYREMGGQIEWLDSWKSAHVSNLVNTMRVRIQGSHLNVFVNDFDMIEEWNIEPGIGSVGLTVGSFDNANVQVAFDDFHLTILDPH